MPMFFCFFSSLILTHSLAQASHNMWLLIMQTKLGVGGNFILGGDPRISQNLVVGYLAGRSVQIVSC